MREEVLQTGNWTKGKKVFELGFKDLWDYMRLD